MLMHNSPHPGAFIKETYLKPFGISVRYLAEKLDVYRVSGSCLAAPDCPQNRAYGTVHGSSS